MAEAARAGLCWGDWTWEQVCLFDVFLGGEGTKERQRERKKALPCKTLGREFLFSRS